MKMRTTCGAESRNAIKVRGLRLASRLEFSFANQMLSLRSSHIHAAKARKTQVRAIRNTSDHPQPHVSSSSSNTHHEKAPLLGPISLALLPLALDVQSAMAQGGEFGLLEGRSAALVHPIVMAGLFFATGYAGYLGYQWKQVRVTGEEIKELKKVLPLVAEGAAAPPPNPQLAAKEAERKALISGNFKDKHAFMGSLLLAAGTGIAIEGCVNTFIRTGKLFPGPHLFAGAAIVSLWALAAALVPEMQKGNQLARDTHIALNCINLALFAWQLPTGFDIVLKVFQFTQWP